MLRGRVRPGVAAVVLTVVLALLSGCGVLSGRTSSPGDAASEVTGTGGEGPSWLVAEQGSPTPSARPTSGGTPAPMPTGFLPLTGATTRTAGPAEEECWANNFDLDKVSNALDVVPSSRTAKLTWYNVGGYNLLEFRLYAISQDLKTGHQRDVGYTVVKPQRPCGWMSATIRNLSPKTHYVFSVDAVVERRSGDGTHSKTIFRSHAVKTR